EAGDACGEFAGGQLRCRVYGFAVQRFRRLSIFGRIYGRVCVADVGRGPTHTGSLASARWNLGDRRALAYALLSILRRDWSICGAAGFECSEDTLVVGWTTARSCCPRGDTQL